MLRLDIDVLWTIINVIIIYLIVRKFLFKPVHNILDAREAEIQKQFADAQNVQNQAMETKKKYEASLDGVAQERAQILEASRGKAMDEYESIVADAQTEAEKIKSTAKVNADKEQEKRRLKEQEEFAKMVVAATAKLVNTEQTPVTDKDLYNQFLVKTGEKSD